MRPIAVPSANQMLLSGPVTSAPQQFAVATGNSVRAPVVVRRATLLVSLNQMLWSGPAVMPFKREGGIAIEKWERRVPSVAKRPTPVESLNHNLPSVPTAIRIPLTGNFVKLLFDSVNRLIPGVPPMYPPVSGNHKLPSGPTTTVFAPLPPADTGCKNSAKARVPGVNLPSGPRAFIPADSANHKFPSGPHVMPPDGPAPNESGTP